MLQRPPLTLVCAALLVAALPVVGFAQFPSARLSSAIPTGVRVGEAADVEIFGVDLDGVTELRFSHPGITAKQKLAEPGPFDKAPQPVEQTFVVQAAANVPPGCYEMRAAGKYGVSNPRLFYVGASAEIVEVEPNNTPAEATPLTLPAAVSGQSNAAADVDYYTIPLTAGQRVIINGLARRIDSRMDLVLAVYDQQGRELANCRDSVLGDPVVDFTAPRAGDYLIKAYDAVYLGGVDYSYRLVVGMQPHIDFVFPPAGLAGNQTYTLFGRNLPGGQNAGVSVEGSPLQKLNVNIATPAATQLNVDSSLDAISGSVDGLTYRLNSPNGQSNAVLIGSAKAKVVLETEPNNDESQSQKLTLPCEVAGQFFPQRDRDWYEFSAKEGERFSLEVISQRLGIKSNPSLLVMQVVPPSGEGAEPTVKMLGLAEDSGDLEGGNEVVTLSEDPQYQFTAPADGVYRIMVHDHHAALLDDPRHVYRLVVRQAQPDFRLTAAPEYSYSAVNLRKGEQAAIRVAAFRSDGFDGEITVKATGLPAGVTASDAIIGPGKTAAAIIIKAAANAADGSAPIKITGTATIGGANAAREARIATALWSQPVVQNNQPQLQIDSRLAQSLVVSVVSDAPSPLTTFNAGSAPLYETSRGGILKIPYNRSGPFTGKILQAEVVDLPPNVTAPRADITAASGEIELKVLAAAVPGTYTLYLDGLAEKVNHSRNPEAAAAAVARQKEVDAIYAKTMADLKAATDAKTVADKAAVDAAAAVAKATAEQTAAMQAMAKADADLKTATENVAKAKAASAAAPADAALKTALTAAETLATNAAAAAKKAADDLAVKQKVLTDAQAVQTTADETKVKADETAVAQKELNDAATKLKADTDKRKTDLEAAAKETQINIPVVSTPFVLKITDAPITVAAIPLATVTQGEKIETPINITRLYGYTAAVTVSNITSPAVPGLSIPNLSIAANQNQGKLAMTAAAATPEGPHQLVLRMTMNFNGQNVIIEQPFQVMVKKAPPAP